MKTPRLLLSSLLTIALASGCATSGGPRSSATTRDVKLPPLGRVALVASDYPHRIAVRGLPKSAVRRDALGGLDQAMVKVTDHTQNEAAMYAAVLMSPVIAGGMIRATTLGAFTGMTKQEIRDAEAFAASPKNVHRLADGVAGSLRATHPNLDWLPGMVSKRNAVVADADSVMEVEVHALRLEQQAGGWKLRGLAVARVIRIADGACLHTFTVEPPASSSQPRPLREWTSPDSPLLRRELDGLVTDLSAQLGQQFLAAVTPK